MILKANPAGGANRGRLLPRARLRSIFGSASRFPKRKVQQWPAAAL